MNRALVTATATDGAAARFALSANERQRCLGLGTIPQQMDFRAGRLAAKRAAGELVGPRPPQRMEVRSGSDSAPSLELLDHRGFGRTPQIALSISHRDGHAVAAAALAGLRVGVDLERAGSVPSRLGRFFLTSSEARSVRGPDITLLWSLKEAAWKALGLGRGVPFKALELCRDPDGALRGVRVRGELVPVCSVLRSPWQGYHMAVVWTTGGGV